MIGMLAKLGRDRLRRDTAIVVLSQAVTLVSGVCFWGIAARAFGASAMGQGALVVGVASSIATFANLSAGPVLERYLPAVGHHAGKLASFAHGLSAALSVAIAGIFVFIDPVPDMFDSVPKIVLILIAALVAATGLQASELIGFGATKWVLRRDLGTSIARVTAIVAMAAVDRSAMAVLVAWIVPGVCALIMCWVTLARGRAPWQIEPQPRDMTLTRQSLRTFWLISLGWMWATALPGLILPLIVGRELGIAEAGYYAAAGQLLAAAQTLMLLAASPYVAAASRPGSDRVRLARSFAVTNAVLCSLRAAGLVVVGLIVMRIYGQEYFDNTVGLLVFTGVAYLLGIPAFWYGALARIHQQIRYPMVVQFLGSTIVIGISWALLPAIGLTAIGVAAIAQELVVAGFATPRLIALWRVETRPPDVLSD